jgi:hypothetical protein
VSSTAATPCYWRKIADFITGSQKQITVLTTTSTLMELEEEQNYAPSIHHALRLCHPE